MKRRVLASLHLIRFNLVFLPDPTQAGIQTNELGSTAMNASDFYPVTGWRTIVGAKENDFAALERLMARYRPPILREMASRANCNAMEAEELAHEFISIWLRRDFLKNVDQKQGRFRNFVKRCIVNFLRDRHRKEANEPEFNIIGEPSHTDGPLLDPPAESIQPEAVIDIAWARQVVALALEQLEQEFVSARWVSRFPRLKPFLYDPESDSYAAVAKDLVMTEQAVRTAISRMRARYGAIIAEEIRENVGPDEDWHDELQYFLKLLGASSSVT